MIFYQNMPNLHNRYKSAERKIAQKNSCLFISRILQKKVSNVHFVRKNRDNLLKNTTQKVPKHVHKRELYIMSLQKRVHHQIK